LARRIGEGGHTTVITEMPAVEHHLRNAGGFGSLGNRLADGLRGSLISAVTNLLAKFFILRARGAERAAIGIIDDLAAYVFQAPKHTEAWTNRRGAEKIPHPVFATRALRLENLLLLHGESPSFIRPAKWYGRQAVFC
jgi:hypothetical protein